MELYKFNDADRVAFQSEQKAFLGGDEHVHRFKDRS